MAGSPCLLILSVLAITTGITQGQDIDSPGTNPSSPEPRPLQEVGEKAPERNGERFKGLGQFDNLQSVLRHSPEKEEKFKKNLQRWEKMPPEEKKVLREGEELRRKKMMQDIEEAIKSSGLQLDKDRREIFALRYIQERRKVEEKLRKEMEEKRMSAFKETIERLKSEFSVDPTTVPHSSPANP